MVHYFAKRESLLFLVIFLCHKSSRSRIQRYSGLDFLQIEKMGCATFCARLEFVVLLLIFLPIRQMQPLIQNAIRIIQ